MNEEFEQLNVSLSDLARSLASGRLACARVERALASDCIETLYLAFEKAMNTPNLPGWQVRVVLDGVRVLPVKYERSRMLKVGHERILDRSALNAFAARGATVLLDDAQSAIPEIAAICSVLTDATERAVAGTVFASPAHSEGFGLHQDAEDVIVVQLSGSKSWQVYEPIVSQDSTMLLEKSVGDVVFDGVLTAGDVMAMPKGSPHKTATNGNDGSLHLTLGIYPVTLRELAVRLLSDVSLAADLDVPVSRAMAGQAMSRLLPDVSFDSKHIDDALKLESRRLVADEEVFALRQSTQRALGGKYRLLSSAGSSMKLLLAAQLGREPDGDLETIVEHLSSVGRHEMFHYDEIRRNVSNVVIAEEVLHALLRLRMVVALD